MNWLLYSSCICVVPVHLSGSVFIFILCTCYICYTQVNKETWTYKISLLDGKVWEQLSAVLSVWIHPDRACLICCSAGSALGSAPHCQQ